MYNEALAARVRELIASTDNAIEEKLMFSGVTFMVNGKMCVSVSKDRILVRVAPHIFEEALEQPGCIPMVRNGKAMKGYIYVDESVVSTTSKLQYWVSLALAYNPLAKAAPKKKK